MKVEFFKHNLDIEEKESVCSALDSEFLTTGSLVTQFEQEFANYLSVDYCVGLSHCTGALHLALLAAGIKEGDEVITTPLTFVATSLILVHIGAKPVWVDVERDTGNLDANLIEAAITPKTKAILPVHLYGQMCDMRAIRKIADNYNLIVIEDAAHALEASRDGIRVGELSDASCFSFYATKSLTCGEGGSLISNRSDIIDKVRLLHTHGIDKEVSLRYAHKISHWDLVELGWKYNMSNIQAALLLPQMSKIEKHWRRRKEIDIEYHKHFSTIMPKIYPNSQSGYHLSTIWVDPNKREKIMENLRSFGIGFTINYEPLHLLRKFRDLFQQKEEAFPETERIGASTISLPLYPKLSDTEVNYVVDSVKKALEK